MITTATLRLLHLLPSMPSWLPLMGITWDSFRERVWLRSLWWNYPSSAIFIEWCFWMSEVRYVTWGLMDYWLRDYIIYWSLLLNCMSVQWATPILCSKIVVWDSIWQLYVLWYDRSVYMLFWYEGLYICFFDMTGLYICFDMTGLYICFLIWQVCIYAFFIWQVCIYVLGSAISSNPAHSDRDNHIHIYART